MPDKYNFDHLGSVRACIEEGCNFKDFVWNLPDEKRQEHYMQHNSSIVIEASKATVFVNRRVLHRQCRKCNEFFEQKRRRGRPFLECENCRKET